MCAYIHTYLTYILYRRHEYYIHKSYATHTTSHKHAYITDKDTETHKAQIHYLSCIEHSFTLHISYTVCVQRLTPMIHLIYPSTRILLLFSDVILPSSICIIVSSVDHKFLQSKIIQYILMIFP